MIKNLTDITLLLDRTGSMQIIRNDVVGGVNTFVDEQKKAEGEADFTLIQFDSQDPHEVIHGAADIQLIPPMTLEDYRPRAWTPLLDAVGIAVTKTGERLSAMSEELRPDKVIFVIFTDGEENSSTEYKKETVREMITLQQETYNWQFVFLGANMDAFASAGSMGIVQQKIARIDKSKMGDAFKVSSRNVSQYRATGLSSALNYSDDQRAQLK